GPGGRVHLTNAEAGRGQVYPEQASRAVVDAGRIAPVAVREVDGSLKTDAGVRGSTHPILRRDSEVPGIDGADRDEGLDGTTADRGQRRVRAVGRNREGGGREWDGEQRAIFEGFQRESPHRPTGVCRKTSMVASQGLEKHERLPPGEKGNTRGDKAIRLRSHFHTRRAGDVSSPVFRSTGRLTPPARRPCPAALTPGRCEDPTEDIRSRIQEEVGAKVWPVQRREVSVPRAERQYRGRLPLGGHEEVQGLAFQVQSAGRHWRGVTTGPVPAPIAGVPAAGFQEDGGLDIIGPGKGEGGRRGGWAGGPSPIAVVEQHPDRAGGGVGGDEIG